MQINWKNTTKKLLLEDHKEFLGKKEKLLEKGIGNVIEIDINTVKPAIMRMKTGTAAGRGDVPTELIKSSGQKLLEIVIVIVIYFAFHIHLCRY
jgi:hypothetical protein